MKQAEKIAHTLQNEPEFIIHGGDVPGHGLDTDHFYQAYDKMNEFYKKYFPGKTIVQAIGNNDVIPHNDHNCDSPILSNLTDLWLEYGWLEKDQEKIFRHSGAHARTVTKDGKLRVIALNSNIFLASSWVNATSDYDCGQFDWMDSELSRAANNDQTVIIVVHAAPVFDSFNDKQLWANETFSKRFRDIIQSQNDKHPGLVQAILMGHVHKDEYRIIHASNMSAFVPVIVAPSISPCYDNNPGFRVVYFDERKIDDSDKAKKIISLRDYDQYYVDLREAIVKNATNWRHDYRFSKAYGKSSLETKSYVSLQNDLESSSRLLSEYMTRYSVHYVKNGVSFLCAYNSDTMDEFNKCMNEMSN